MVHCGWWHGLKRNSIKTQCLRYLLRSGEGINYAAVVAVECLIP